MALLTLADRVAETTTTTGTGTLSLGGAVDGKFRTFVAGAGSGNTVPYVMVHRTANEWEVGYGVVTAGSPDTLTRAGVYSSSSGGSAVTFSAGTKDVFLGLPAGKTVTFDDTTGAVTIASLTVSGDLTVDTNTLYVDAVNNRVGVGTASPGDTMDVAGIIRSRNEITAYAASGTDRAIIAPQATGSGAKFLAVNAANNAYTPALIDGSIVALQTSSTERARITAGGDFLAGLTTAINGHGFKNANGVDSYRTTSTTTIGIHHFYSDVTSTQNLVAYVRADGGLANYSANNLNLASDARLKQDVVPLTSTWDKLKAIEVVNFRYKGCAEGDPMLYGVIAQQIQPVAPDLVVVTREATDDDSEYYGIREQPMQWLAIKALQEAMARIETLEARVAALEAK